jgi:hypothetical protein
MYLNEEQMAQREELFLELMETIAEELYESNPEYEMTEEDAYIASEIMEHFIEHYVQLSLKESAILTLTGQEDPNQELFEEIVDLALDESIGGAIAGAVHGISNFLSGARKKRAASSAASAQKSHDATYDKMRAAQKAAKGSSGLVGTFRKAKAASLEKRRNAAFDYTQAAHAKANATKAAHVQGMKSRVGLKKRIDTGISNIKNKVSTAVKSGAERVAGAAGRAAGRFA